MERAWFVQRSDGVEGPLDESDLRRLAADGLLDAGDSIRASTSENWVRAGSIKGLLRSAFDVFMSHSSKDAELTQALVHHLESEGIRCWVAPRDIRPGQNYSAGIMAGIKSCRALVLVLSEHSNQSQQVLQEVERAVSRRLHIIPFRIENVAPSDDLELFIGPRHWLDAFPRPLVPHFRQLVTALRAVLELQSSDQPSDRESDPSGDLKGETTAKLRHRVAATIAVAVLAIAAVTFWQSGSKESDASIKQIESPVQRSTEEPGPEPTLDLAGSSVEPPSAAPSFDPAVERDRLLQILPQARTSFWLRVEKRGEAVRELQAQVVDRMRDDRLDVLLVDPTSPFARAPYAVELVRCPATERAADGYPSRGVAWRITPIRDRSNPLFSAQDPLQLSAVDLFAGRVGDELGAHLDESTLVVVPGIQTGSPVPLHGEPSSMAADIMRAGTRWRGEPLGESDGNRIELAIESRRSDASGVDVRFVSVDDPYRAASYRATLFRRGALRAAWQFRLDVRSEERPPLDGPQSICDGSAEIAYAAVIDERTILLQTDGQQIVFTPWQVLPEAKTAAPRLPNGVACGGILEHGHGAEPMLMRISIVESKDSPTNRRLIVEARDDPFLIAAFDFLPPERDSDSLAWPAGFRRVQSSVPSTQSGMFGGSDGTLRMRAVDDSHLIAWIGTERLDLRLSSRSELPWFGSERHWLEIRSKLQAEPSWIGTCESDDGDSVPLAMICRPDDASQSTAEVEFVSGGVAAIATARVATAMDRDVWSCEVSISPKRRGDASTSVLLAESQASARLRLLDDGSLVGYLGEREITLRPGDASTIVADVGAAPAESAAANAESGAGDRLAADDSEVIDTQATAALDAAFSLMDDADNAMNAKLAAEAFQRVRTRFGGSGRSGILVGQISRVGEARCLIRMVNQFRASQWKAFRDTCTNALTVVRGAADMKVDGSHPRLGSSVKAAGLLAGVQIHTGLAKMYRDRFDALKTETDRKSFIRHKKEASDWADRIEREVPHATDADGNNIADEARRLASGIR